MKLALRMRSIMLLTALSVLTVGSTPATILAASCEDVVRQLNQKLTPKIDEQELVSVLESLNQTGNRRLPVKFVTKKQARKTGWQPGQDLWTVQGLNGKSIGGDSFANREGRLPNDDNRWREADLDYKGGRRGAKRIVFSNDGARMVTVDHYETFTEVPACK